jgi:hypothetical protein
MAITYGMSNEESMKAFNEYLNDNPRIRKKLEEDRQQAIKEIKEKFNMTDQEFKDL